jgi:hypothetical protein
VRCRSTGGLAQGVQGPSGPFCLLDGEVKRMASSPGLFALDHARLALGIADHVWTLGDLLDAALATQPIDPIVTAPDRRRRFRVIEGGKTD